MMESSNYWEKNPIWKNKGEKLFETMADTHSGYIPVKQIDEVLDISTEDISLFRTSSFHFNDKKFILKKPATCSLKYQNYLWICECPRYGLHTFSENKPEALQQLNEEFAFLSDGLIHEPNDNLTQDAIKLRDLLKSDVLKVEKI